MRFLLSLAGVVAAVSFAFTAAVAADLSPREKTVVSAVNNAVKNAGAATPLASMIPQVSTFAKR